MSPTLAIVLWWLLFAGSHMLLSSTTVRPRVVARLGERGFAAAYSLLALAISSGLVATYFGHKHEGPHLWTVALVGPARWGFHAAMGLAFVLLAAGIVTPSPAVTGSKQPTTARGVQLLTRHGVIMGAGLFGALHLIPNGFATDIAFFAGFPAFAVVGCWHQDRRKRATQPHFDEFVAATPFLPFTGRHTLRGLRELSPLGLVIGVAVTVLLRWFHVPWFQ
ncbi:MAG: NnrU family protein [Proteobacteria bacterium]|nr:NnrU family protein [Pseudomonadota bacterium]